MMRHLHPPEPERLHFRRAHQLIPSPNPGVALPTHGRLLIRRSRRLLRDSRELATRPQGGGQAGPTPATQRLRGANRNSVYLRVNGDFLPSGEIPGHMQPNRPRENDRRVRSSQIEPRHTLGVAQQRTTTARDRTIHHYSIDQFHLVTTNE